MYEYTKQLYGLPYMSDLSRVIDVTTTLTRMRLSFAMAITMATLAFYLQHSTAEIIYIITQINLVIIM